MERTRLTVEIAFSAIPQSSLTDAPIILEGQIEGNHASPLAEPAIHKKRPLTPDQRKVLREKVFEQLREGIIRRVQHLGWVANAVPIKQRDGGARVSHVIPIQVLLIAPQGTQPSADVGKRRRRDKIPYRGTEDNLVKDVEEMMDKPQRVNVKIDPSKCTFEIEEAIHLNFYASEDSMDYEALLAGPVASTDKGMKDLNVFMGSKLLVDQVEGSRIPRTKEAKKYREEIMDATTLFHRPYCEGFGAFAWWIPILVTVLKIVLPHSKLFEGFKVHLGEDPIQARRGGLRARGEDAMVWRHPDAAIDDLRLATCSFSMVDVHRLSAHVIKLRDMPEVIGIHDFLYLPEWTGAEVQEEPHLDVRSAQAQSSGSTTRLSLFVGDSDDESDGDDDACIEIPLVTPLCSAAVIPSLGNQGRSFNAPAAEGPNTRDSWGKDVSGDAIHADFFPFSAGPYYATYPQDGVAGNYEFTREEWDASYRSTFRILTKEVFKDPAVCKIVVDPFPTPSEMVRVEALSEDQLTTKMSVLHCNAPLFWSVKPSNIPFNLPCFSGSVYS
ncbi:hypothetical protein Tco_0800178 [Tanacetum coccineum]|uniref:Uncharacterized protein n=1 Tax=Tanacetum coccineum TaxID=301880 RepID=A0ABQ4ZSD5_9ASTR